MSGRVCALAGDEIVDAGGSTAVEAVDCERSSPKGIGAVASRVAE